MRIRSIDITSWRNFENIRLQLSDDSGLVCLVGANGTGKSHLLELISSCAQRFGLARGIDIPRGDPFNDSHEFSVQMFLTPGISTRVDEGMAGHEQFGDWDRTLTIRSRKGDAGTETLLLAGGIDDQGQSTGFAQQVSAHLNKSKDVHFLSLDADRAYPKKNINVHEIAAAFDIDWGDEEYTRGRSFKPSSTLYDEWIKYFLASENQSGTKLIQHTRRARGAGEADPVFEDHFREYTTSLQKVLPHLVFSGVELKKKTLLFDTTGMELAFDQLSGGEREIAFLVGQIDRFGLKQGLFLLDEPELHLNPDLVRAWVAYMTGTVESGQIWLATHSLEAVEAAGQMATFVLERNPQSRKVDSLVRLDARPVLSALSRAVGTPAFSISQLRFVFIEGEESLGERERFRKLTGHPTDVRFIECGSCNEVTRRVDAVKTLSEEADEVLRIGGVVDRDRQTPQDVQTLMDVHSVYALQVHELENFFIEPRTLQAVLDQNGIADCTAEEFILQASDRRAGAWIFQNAMARDREKSLPMIIVAAKDIAKDTAWGAIDANREAWVEQVVDASGYCDDHREKFKNILGISIRSYERKRDEADLWKHCEGKQVLASLAPSAGFAGFEAMITAVFTAWNRDEKLIPVEVADLRRYIDTL